jgi:hypothetical protein
MGQVALSAVQSVLVTIVCASLFFAHTNSKDAPQKERGKTTTAKK